MALGLELFLSLIAAVLALFSVAALWWAKGAVQGSTFEQFAEWVSGATIAFLFTAFTRVFELLDPNFGTITTYLSLIAFVIGTVYLTRAAFALRKIGEGG